MSFFLKESRIIPELEKTSKDGVLAQLAGVLAADLSGVRARRVLEVLWERENIGSTGVGQGIAIPHGRLAGVATPVAALGRSQAGVDFMAMDGLPVHLVVALLLPPEASESHLQLLAAISRMLRHPDSRRRLMLAPDRAALCQVALTAAEEL
ncbi:MAG: PTS sugar transporter subunit IIA [Magnetococcales bacterium]|nr:PTS sugar transporter subunit IIA [Magnetococcales bacterium]